jgi:hypothetical protein
MKDERYHIKHPTLGWFVTRKEFEGKDVGSNKMTEVFSNDKNEASSYTLADLRMPMDATGRGLLALLVSGYSGLRLEAEA